ncbi:MAG: hypothetical protein J7J82_05010 [Staphylothermus sp.]|nr:hypothetical protein [Staphylothermus sp.]
MVKALDLSSKRSGLFITLLIISAILLSAISLYTETSSHTFKKTIQLYDNNIIDLTSIIDEKLLYHGIISSYLQIELVDCKNTIEYKIIDTYHNITRTFTISPGDLKTVNLTSPFSVIVFNNTGVNYCCKVDLTLTITNIERKYAILSIPAFIIGAVSLFLMMLFLVEYTVTKIYEKRNS